MSHPPLYRPRNTTFVQGRVYRGGEEFSYDGEPSIAWEPLNDEARARIESRREDEAERRRKQRKEASYGYNRETMQELLDAVEQLTIGLNLHDDRLTRLEAELLARTGDPAPEGGRGRGRQAPPPPPSAPEAPPVVEPVAEAPAEAPVEPPAPQPPEEPQPV